MVPFITASQKDPKVFYPNGATIVELRSTGGQTPFRHQSMNLVR